MKKMKSFLSFLLVLMLILTWPGDAFAADGGIEIEKVFTTIDNHTPEGTAYQEGNTYVVQSDGSLWAAGVNYTGQIGDGTTEDRLSFVKVLDGVSNVLADFNSVHALKGDGSLWEWGKTYDAENKISSKRLRPEKVMEDVKSFTVLGVTNTYVVKEDSTLWGWGSDEHGQLGTGNRESSNSPVKIMDEVDSVYVAGGGCFALKLDGSLWSWGYTADGLLGDGGGLNQMLAKPVKVLDGVKSFTTADLSGNIVNAYALKTDGELFAWGSQLVKDDMGLDGSTPRSIADGVKSIRGDDSSVFITKEDDSLWGLGACIRVNNDLGVRESMTSPAKIFDTQPAAIDSSYDSVAMLQPDGSLWTWGESSGNVNASNKFGEDKHTNYKLPYKLMEGVAELVDRKGELHAGRYTELGLNGFFAIKEDSTLWAWGDNDFGMLGCGDVDHVIEPTQVLDSVASVFAGSRMTYVTRKDGSVWGFGNDSSGGCFPGAGDKEHHSIPIEVKFGDSLSNSEFDVKEVPSKSKLPVGADSKGNFDSGKDETGFLPGKWETKTIDLPVVTKLTGHKDGSGELKVIVGSDKSENLDDVEFKTLKKAIDDVKEKKADYDLLKKIYKAGGLDHFLSQDKLLRSAPKFQALGYAVFDISKDGDWGLKDSNVVVKGDWKGKLAFQFTSPAGPIYASLSYGFGAEAQLSFMLDGDTNMVAWAKRADKAPAQLSADVSVGAEGGYGVSGLATAGIGGEAKLGSEFLAPTGEEGWSTTGKLDASLFAKLNLVGFEWTYTVASLPTATIWDTTDGGFTGAVSSLPARSLTAALQASPAVSEAKVSFPDRSYASQAGSWRPEGDAIEDGAGNNNVKVLSGGFMPSALPQVEKVGGKYVTVFTMDDLRRAPQDSSELVYSVNDGNGWSAPAPVHPEVVGTADSNASLGMVGDDLYVVWQKMRQPIQGADAQAALDNASKEAEIAVSRFDPESNGFTDFEYLGQTLAPESMPVLVGGADVPTVAFVRNLSGNEFGSLVPTHGKNRIVVSTKRDGKWSEKTVAEVGAPVGDLVSFVSEGRTETLWTVSSTGVSTLHSSIRGKLASAGQIADVQQVGGDLYWFQDEGMRRLGKDKSPKEAEDISADGELMNASARVLGDGSIVWSGKVSTGDGDEEKNAILASARESSGYSAPITVASLDEEAAYFDVACTGLDDFRAVANLGATDSKVHRIADVDGMRGGRVELGAALRTAEPVKDGKARVALYIRNDSADRMESLDVKYGDGTSQKVDCDLDPGESGVVYCDAPVAVVSSVLSASGRSASLQGSDGVSGTLSVSLSDQVSQPQSMGYDDSSIDVSSRIVAHRGDDGSIKGKVRFQNAGSSTATGSFSVTGLDGSDALCAGEAQVEPGGMTIREFTLDASEASAAGGSLRVEFTPSNGTDLDDSDNSSICDVSASDLTDSTDVASVSLNEGFVTLGSGESVQLVVTTSPEGAGESAFTWVSSDTSVVTVDKSGKVAALSPGSAVITVVAQPSLKTATCEVTVSGDAQGETEVTAIAPIRHGNTVVIPSLSGIAYTFGGAEVSGYLDIPEGGSLEISARAEEGYKLTGDTSWTFRYAVSGELIELRAEKPSRSGDQVTIPSIGGITYLVGGNPVDGTINIPDDGLKVTAKAGDGYKLTGVSEWFFEHSDSGDPIEVKAKKPSRFGNKVIVPSVAGVSYFVEGKPVGGTVGIPENGLKVTAEAEEGYKLAGTAEWFFEYQKPEEPGKPDNPGGGYVPPAIAAKGFAYDIAGGRLTPVEVIELSKAKAENVDAELAVDKKSLSKLNAAIVKGDKGEYEVSVFIRGKDLKKSFKVKLIGRLPEVSFRDVAEGTWYRDVVISAARMGYVNGHGGSYRPDDTLTRAEAAAVIYNMAGGEEVCGDGYADADVGFMDLAAGAWYLEPVSWAHSVGVVNGHAGLFRPDDLVTRAEFAAMLANFECSQGGKLAGGDISGFPDADDIPGWAKEPVSWAASKGIMGNGGRLSSNAHILRSEAAAMAVNYQPGGMLFERVHGR